MIWYIEPNQRPDQKTLVLEKNGMRFLCPLINGLEWSIQALKDLSKSN